MVKIENNYLSIANNDYEFALACRIIDFNNNLAVLCEQAIENLLKSVIEKTVINSEVLLRSNNLNELYNSVEDKLKISKSISAHLSMIADFYSNTRYPGDDFINVTDDELDICFTVMEEVHRVVNEWHLRNSNSVLDSVFLEASRK